MAIGVEFFVEDVVTDRSGRPIFIGVPNQGRSVRVGDKFVLRYEVPRTVEDVLNDRPRADPVNQQNVALTVTAIDSMRRLVEELPLGVTGALYLEGDGMEQVSKKTYLRTSS